MTVDDFKEIILCNEPEFEYNDQFYSICSPNGRYYVTASDSPKDEDLEFSSVEELLDDWIIQGKTLREILPEIKF